MAEKKDYPKRLFEAGEIPIMRKSFNHWCKLKEFEMMQLAIGEDAFNDIRDNFSVGVFLKLATMNYTWAAKPVDWLIMNQLKVDREKEVWVLVGCRPIRFSLYEFEEITHMNCGVVGEGADVTIAHEEFWSDIKTDPTVGPNFKELKFALTKCSKWSLEKRRMLGLLFILHVGVYGLNRGSRLDLSVAKRVLDIEAFERYPWGREAFRALVESIKVAAFDGATYALHGPVHVLLIWGYEYIPAFGKLNRCNEEEEIPLIRWGASRFRGTTLEAVLEDDKLSTADKKIRVEKNMVHKALEEIYPAWPRDKEDPKLHNMIRDILDGSLDESFWDTEKNTGKRKIPLADREEKKQRKVLAKKVASAGV